MSLSVLPLGMSWAGLASSATSLLLGSALFAGLGMGGGLVYRPTLLLLGWDPHLALSTSCLLVTVSGLVAGVVFSKFALADKTLAVILGGSAAAGSFMGGLCAPSIPALWLSAFTSAGILSALGLSEWGRRRPEDSTEGQKHDVPSPHPRRSLVREVGGHRYSLPLAIVVPVALVTGFSASWIGIGGGLLLVPILSGPLKVPIKVAVGTSAWGVILIGATSTVGHAVGGSFAGWAVLPLVPAVAAGAGLGAFFSSKLKGKTLHGIVSSVCLLVALFFMARTVWMLWENHLR